MHKFRIGISIVLIAFLVGCGNDTSTSEEVKTPPTEMTSADMDSEDTTEESDEDDMTEEAVRTGDSDDDDTIYLKPCATYQDILDNTYEVIVSDRDADIVVEDGLFSTVGIRESLGRNTEEILADIGYIFYDVDGNGIEELIIADTMQDDGGPWDNRILLMYTLHDDKPVLLIDGWARNRYYLLKDNTIYNESSSSAADTTFSTCRIAEDEISLEIIESRDENMMDGSYKQVKKLELTFFNSMLLQQSSGR